jgi:hypothetical protein
MSQHEPEGLYIYQPFGIQNPVHWASGRIYGIGGMPLPTTLTGLTRPEAEAILAALSGEFQRKGKELCSAYGNALITIHDLLQAANGAEIMIGFLLEYAERHPAFTKVSKRNANVTRVRLMDAIENAQTPAALPPPNNNPPGPVEPPKPPRDRMVR